MKHKEKTYIGSAEIRFDNTARRDRLVAAAEKAGFQVRCSEAIGISLSGASSPVHWYISVSMPGELGPMEKREARVRLAAAWRGL